MKFLMIIFYIFYFGHLSSQRIEIIVIEFDSYGKSLEADDGVIVANSFRDLLAEKTTQASITVLEKDKIDDILVELSNYESESGLYSNIDFVEVGNFKKADYIIAGSVAKSEQLFNGVSISARIIDVRTREIKKAKERIYTKHSDFLKVRNRICNELLTNISNQKSIPEFDIDCLNINISRLIGDSNYGLGFSYVNKEDENFDRVAFNLGLQAYNSKVIGLLKSDNIGILLTERGITWRIVQLYRCPNLSGEEFYEENSEELKYESSGSMTWEEIDDAIIEIDQYAYSFEGRKDWRQRKKETIKIKSFRLLINGVVIVNDHNCFTIPNIFNIRDIFSMIKLCAIF